MDGPGDKSAGFEYSADEDALAEFEELLLVLLTDDSSPPIKLISSAEFGESDGADRLSVPEGAVRGRFAAAAWDPLAADDADEFGRVGSGCDFGRPDMNNYFYDGVRLANETLVNSATALTSTKGTDAATGDLVNSVIAKELEQQNRTLVS